MQTITAYLYSNKLEAYTNSSADWKTERYRRVYNRNVKAFRGVSNRIDLQIRNSDQKFKDVSASAVVFTLIETDQQKKVLEKDCGVVSKLNGRFFIDLTEHDLDNIEPGFYQYSLRTESRTTLPDGNYQVNNSNPMYTDSQYGATATIEILGSIQGEPQSSVVIREFRRIVDFQENKTRFISSIVDGRGRVSTPQRLHTFQVYPINYTGYVTIEGSLDESASPVTWTELASAPIHASSESIYLNVEGKYNWFRVRHDAESNELDGTFLVTLGTYDWTYNVEIVTGGRDYKVGDVIFILGRNLGSESPTNDLTITVTSVDNIGAITGIEWTGSSQNGARAYIVSGRNPDLVGSVDKILYR